MAAAILDTVVTAETPEGIQLELRPAGLCPRFYAFMIDWGVRLMVLVRRPGSGSWDSRW
jgi:hypothetical protein